MGQLLHSDYAALCVRMFSAPPGGLTGGLGSEQKRKDLNAVQNDFL